MAPVDHWGVAAFAFMLFTFGIGAVLIFINFLAMRQAVTPEPLLGRMTSTMRWLILLPAGPGALIGGWLGEHVGLRAALAFAGVGGLLLAAVAAWLSTIRQVRVLPKPEGRDRRIRQRGHAACAAGAGACVMAAVDPLMIDLPPLLRSKRLLLRCPQAGDGVALRRGGGAIAR